MSYSTTVLMSAFYKECPEYIDQALRSLYEQTIPPSEIIIVYEGEENASISEVFSFWQKKFTLTELRIISAGDTKGFPACLNKGLFLAKGDYIIRFDTDDICKQDRIEKQLNFFKENQDVSLISACMEEYDDTLTTLTGIRNVPLSNEEILKYAKWRNPFNHPSVAYKTSVAVSLGGYPNVGANEDYAFFCLFLQKGYKAANLSDILVKARTGQAFAGRRRGKKYLKGEIESLKYIHSIGFYNTLQFYIQLILKKIFRSLPKGFVGKFYQLFLRKKI